MPRGQGDVHPPPTIPDRNPLVILADDLTGACDAAAAFASTDAPVRVTIDGTPTPALITALSTESRDVTPAEAEHRLRSALAQLPPAATLFKKIDSVFRGNTLAEIATVLRHARYDLALLAPAFPALGRTVHNGVVHIRDTSGDRTLPLGDLLAQSGCSFASVPSNRPTEALAASLQQCIANGLRAVLCDASTQPQLAQIAQAARSLHKQILWIGSGGLAHALAEPVLSPHKPGGIPPPHRLPLVISTELRASEGSRGGSGETPEFRIPPGQPFAPRQPQASPTPKPPTGRTIFFIGSTHPVTTQQLDQLRQLTTIAEHRATLIPIDFARTTPEQIRHSVASQDPRQTACLFLTGGDTAHFICRALGIHALRLLHEFAPGVPVALAEGGPFDGVRVILKSGGFGAPDLLCRLLEQHRPAPEVLA